MLIFKGAKPVLMIRQEIFLSFIYFSGVFTFMYLLRIFVSLIVHTTISMGLSAILADCPTVILTGSILTVYLRYLISDVYKPFNWF